MNRLVFLVILTHLFLLIDSSNLQRFSIKECDQVPKSTYDSVYSSRHYYIAADDWDKEYDITHIFTLIHCSLPPIQSVIHSLSNTNEFSNEVYEHHPQVAISISYKNIRVSPTAEIIRELCRIIYNKLFPPNSIVMLFMKPFDCNETFPTLTSRIAFFQTSNHQAVTLTRDLVKVYNLNLDAFDYLAFAHFAAHNLTSLVPPHLETVNVVLLHEYTDDMPSMGLLTTPYLILLVIASFIIGIVLVVVTLELEYRVGIYYLNRRNWIRRARRRRRRRRVIEEDDDTTTESTTDSDTLTQAPTRSVSTHSTQSSISSVQEQEGESRELSFTAISMPSAVITPEAAEGDEDLDATQLHTDCDSVSFGTFTHPSPVSQ